MTKQTDVERIVAGAEAAAVERLSEAANPNNAPAEAAHAIRQSGLQGDVLKVVLARFGPLAARAALGYVAEEYGPTIQQFLKSHDDQIGSTIGPEEWARVKSVLSVFLPGNLERVARPI